MSYVAPRTRRTQTTARRFDGQAAIAASSSLLALAALVWTALI